VEANDALNPKEEILKQEGLLRRDCGPVLRANLSGLRLRYEECFSGTGFKSVAFYGDLELPPRTQESNTLIMLAER
jgi:hypothetical protein